MIDLEIPTKPAGTEGQFQANIGGVFGAVPMYWNGLEVSLGVDGTGYDFKLFGATSGKYMLWDESEDTLIIEGSTISGTGNSITSGIANNIFGGYSSIGGADYSFIAGYYSSITAGTANAVFGQGNTCSSYIGGTVFGYANNNAGIYGTVGGANNTLSGAGAVGFGQYNTITGQGAVVIGSNSIARGLKGICVGSSTLVWRTGGLNIGGELYNGATGGTLIGNNMTNYLTNSVMLGGENANVLIYDGEMFVFDSATLGSEIITNGTLTGGITPFTVSGNCAYGTNNVVKTAGATGTLTYPRASFITTPSQGDIYRITFDLTNFTAGTVTVSFAGVVFESITTTHAADSLLTTWTLISPYYSSLKDLIFTFNSTAVCTIDNVSVKKIIGGNLSVAGNIQTSNEITMLSDGSKIHIGAGDDLQFYHDGTNSYIYNNTGVLKIQDAGSGIQIGTAASEKLGFYGLATPIVQPTTAIGAATFVTNTSLIANDTATFDGYTIGQICKALRNLGILA